MEVITTKTRSQTKKATEEKEKIDAAATLLKLHQDDAEALRTQLEEQDRARRAIEEAKTPRPGSVASQATIDDRSVPASFREGRAEVELRALIERRRAGG
ncbi:hypothetical protein BU16DRAFT_557432 [Lophium mytilinum]|uniref:Uncharacterized protein n=1 Tax=Lophium mytilinum TaxID=390894 RepID=A0A6A6R3H2_9PEZI|nr:hypothetical protein BU16DRAFT_557432 [Lophium mytilinum]